MTKYKVIDLLSRAFVHVSSVYLLDLVHTVIVDVLNDNISEDFQTQESNVSTL